MSDAPFGERKKMGRPTIYSEELAARICHLVATHSFGLKKLTKTYPDLPAQDTINDWRRKFPDFSAQYAQAKREQADLLAEEIMEIADEGSNDWMAVLGDDEKGIGWKINGEHVQRSRLRIDSRKWLAGKLAPKIYGTSNEDEKPKSDTPVEQYVLRRV